MREDSRRDGQHQQRPERRPAAQRAAARQLAQARTTCYENLDKTLMTTGRPVGAVPLAEQRVHHRARNVTHWHYDQFTDGPAYSYDRGQAVGRTHGWARDARPRPGASIDAERMTTNDRSTSHAARLDGRGRPRACSRSPSPSSTCCRTATRRCASPARARRPQSSRQIRQRLGLDKPWYIAVRQLRRGTSSPATRTAGPGSATPTRTASRCKAARSSSARRARSS